MSLGLGAKAWSTQPNARRLLCGLLLACAASLAQASPLTLIERDGGYLSIEAYGANIVRITLSSDKKQTLAPSGYGISAPADNASWSHRREQGADVYSSPELSVEVEAEPEPHAPTQEERYFAPHLPPVALTVRDAQGRILVHMSGWSLAPHTVNGENTFRAGATFSAPSDEHYYGLGQNQEGTLDYRGRTIDCKHYYDAAAGETVCVPFLVSSKGYGIVWDNPSETVISAAINGRTAFNSEVGERVSYFVLSGPSSDALYLAYRKLTGATPLPPKAAFGYIQSRARYESQQQLLDVAEGYRTRHYPLDIMVLDWFYWTHMGQLDIDRRAFPDPALMNRQLHDEGMRTIISVWPRFERQSRYFDFLADKGWLLKDKDGKPVDGLAVRSDRAGALIDSTNPDARAWFWDRMRDNIVSQGFDWFWLDETEPDLVPDGYFYSVGSGDRYHNLFPLLHTQGVAEGSRRDRPQLRNLILARAAYLGAQRNGCLFWSSDIDPSWEALRRQVPTGLDFTASGLAYWGSDIGGWQSLPKSHKPQSPPLLDPSDARAVVRQYDDYPELVTRWYEYATFTPTMRAHGSRSGTEAWSYGREAEKIIAKYLRLRYSLLPYIYSLGHHTYESGAPFMRALFMDFPHDAKALQIGDEYMFGPALLVAPVTEQGRTSREVYLPAGSDWYNFWSNERLSGGQTVTVASPIDTIPLFVRAGSILPLGNDIQSTASAQTLREIRVYPGADAEFALYDDDGISYDYEKNRGVRLTTLSWSETEKQLKSQGPGVNPKDLKSLLRLMH